MYTKLVVGRIPPGRLDSVINLVHDEVVPGYVRRSGDAQMGVWMANSETGQVLEVTFWPDLRSLEQARSLDGEMRARIAEVIGITVTAVHTAKVIGEARAAAGRCQCLARCARATWVGGLSREREQDMRSLHRELVPFQIAAEGFFRGYWIADYDTGNGLGLSLWASSEEMRRAEPVTRPFRRRFEQMVDARVETVSEFQVIATTEDRPAEAVDLSGWDDRSAEIAYVLSASRAADG